MPWCWWWAGWYVDWCEPEQLEGRRPVSVVQRQFTILRPDTFRPLSPSSHQHHTSPSSIKYQLTLHLNTSYHKKSFVYFEPTSALCSAKCSVKISKYVTQASPHTQITSFFHFPPPNTFSTFWDIFAGPDRLSDWQTDKPVTRSVYPVTRSRDTHNNAGTFRLYFLQIPESEHFQFSAWVLRSTLSFLLEIFRLWAERVFWLLIVGLTLLQLLGDPLTGEHTWDAAAFLELKLMIVFSFWLQDHYIERDLKNFQMFLLHLFWISAAASCDIWVLLFLLEVGGGGGWRTKTRRVGWRLAGGCSVLIKTIGLHKAAHSSI